MADVFFADTMAAALIAGEGGGMGDIVTVVDRAAAVANKHVAPSSARTAYPALRDQERERLFKAHDEAAKKFTMMAGKMTALAKAIKSVLKCTVRGLAVADNTSTGKDYPHAWARLQEDVTKIIKEVGDKEEGNLAGGSKEGLEMDMAIEDLAGFADLIVRAVASGQQTDAYAWGDSSRETQLKVLQFLAHPKDVFVRIPSMGKKTGDKHDRMQAIALHAAHFVGLSLTICTALVHALAKVAAASTRLGRSSFNVKLAQERADMLEPLLMSSIMGVQVMDEQDRDKMASPDEIKRRVVAAIRAAVTGKEYDAFRNALCPPVVVVDSSSVSDAEEKGGEPDGDQEEVKKDDDATETESDDEEFEDASSGLGDAVVNAFVDLGRSPTPDPTRAEAAPTVSPGAASQEQSSGASQQQRLRPGPSPGLRPGASQQRRQRGLSEDLVNDPALAGGRDALMNQLLGGGQEASSLLDEILAGGSDEDDEQDEMMDV